MVEVVMVGSRSSRVWVFVVLVGLLCGVVSVSGVRAGEGPVGVRLSVGVLAGSGGGWDWNKSVRANESWSNAARKGYERLEDRLGVDRDSTAYKAGYVVAAVVDSVSGGVGLAKGLYNIGKAAYKGVKFAAKQGAKGTAKAIIQKASRTIENQVQRIKTSVGSTKTAARSCSFSGDTPVLMADGTLKPIDHIRPGDLVIATDPETGEQITTPVEEVFVHTDTLIVLGIDGENLTTTPNHPFWSVTDQRFEPASELSPGERILTAAGTTVTVTGLQPATTRPGLAYNLSITTIHTYHVGTNHILVHNTCPITNSPATKATPSEGIYVVRNGAGEVYVGQSGDIASRLRQHVSKGKFTQEEVDAAERIEVLGGKTAREIQEQLKLDSFGGRDAPGILNKVNPIGDRRLNLMPPGYVQP